MLASQDEGFIEEEMMSPGGSTGGEQRQIAARTVREREGMCPTIPIFRPRPANGRLSSEIAYRILASLPRSSLAVLQSRIAPLLKLDIVGVRARLGRGR